MHRKGDMKLGKVLCVCGVFLRYTAGKLSPQTPNTINHTGGGGGLKYKRIVQKEKTTTK